jgi:hypothetical protein
MLIKRLLTKFRKQKELGKTVMSEKLAEQTCSFANLDLGDKPQGKMESYEREMPEKARSIRRLRLMSSQV